MDANTDIPALYDITFSLTDFPTDDIKTELKSKFRFWHTESLLNQSATLIDQCLKDLIQLKQLEMLEFSLLQEITLAEKELSIEEARVDAFDRDSKLNALRYQGLIERDAHDRNATRDAINSTNHETGNTPHHTRIRDGITLHERYVTDAVQKYERLVAEQESVWFRDDSEKNKDFFNFRKDQLNEKKKQLDATKALDFSYQKKLCEKRLMRNYDDCLQRAVIAEDGLRLIYGYPETLEERLLLNGDLQYKITELHNWIYECIVQLTAYSQLDQSFTVCLSLKSLLSANEFHNLTTRTDTITIGCLVDKSYFPTETHQNIRFKGIGASLIGRVGTIPWKIKIRLPYNAVYLRDGDEFNIHQSDVPTCILGWVENRNSIRGIEYGGVVSLNNLSPIAFGDGAEFLNHWELTIDKPKSDSEEFQNIEDVVIELNLTGKLL